MRKLLCVVLTVLFLLPSCGETPPLSGWYTFADDTGRTVVLERMPERVAVLTSSFAEIWILAGGGLTVTVGESVERGFADDTVILVDEGAGKSINTELLLASELDFVIVSSDIPAQVQTAELLRNTGIPAAQMKVESFADYLRVLEIFTDITGNRDAYRKYGTDVKAEIDGIFDSVPENSAEKPKILFIRAGSSEKSTKAKTAKEHFACVMLDELGTYNIADSAPVLMDGLSEEEILLQDPEIIFLTAMGNEDATKANISAMFETPVYKSIRAVRNDRVYWLPKELFQYKPNAKWADAYRMLAEILYEE